ncbi:MAG: DUF4921 family protein [Candidatus Firestonebacteria bacterium]|nr:DUF4921 family protein [Candidatus Firestonebacteria bacterium]
MSELRRDIILDRWVIISSRELRKSVIFGKSVINKDSVKECPFCPDREKMTPSEIFAYRPDKTPANSPGWVTRVIPNKFPVLGIEGEINQTGVGMFDKMNGIGAHEIIIETTEHDIDIPDSDLKSIENVIWMYRDRIADLKKDIRFKYITIFRNRGWDAGSYYDHPYSNLIATPVIPMNIESEMSGALRYYKYKERCIFCDIIKQEILSQERLISQNNSFISYTPFASIYPFEICIIPRKHSSNFEEISISEVIDLAKILKDTLKRISIALNKPAYNYIIHTAPSQVHGMEDYHWHIEIIPRVIKTAGFEWGTGFYINPTSPEDAAQYLKKLQIV